MGHMVEELFLASIRNAITKKEVHEWAFEGHRSILEALQARDPERIREAVTFSLVLWSKVLLVKERFDNDRGVVGIRAGSEQLVKTFDYGWMSRPETYSPQVIQKEATFPVRDVSGPTIFDLIFPF